MFYFLPCDFCHWYKNASCRAHMSIFRAMRSYSMKKDALLKGKTQTVPHLPSCCKYYTTLAGEEYFRLVKFEDFIVALQNRKTSVKYTQGELF